MQHLAVAQFLNYYLNAVTPVTFDGQKQVSGLGSRGGDMMKELYATWFVPNQGAAQQYIKNEPPFIIVAFVFSSFTQYYTPFQLRKQNGIKATRIILNELSTNKMTALKNTATVHHDSS